MAVLCPGSGKWDSSSLDVDTVKAPDDAGVSFSNFDPPPDRYLFVPDIGQANLDKKPALNPRDSGLFGGFQYREQLNDTPIAPFIDDFLYLPQVSFTATDAGEVETHGVLSVLGVSPLRTPPDKTTTYDSYNANGSFSADESIHLGTSTALTRWSNTMDRKEPGDERQCGSIHIRAYSTPLNTDKRRILDTVEPGSARAIYLEKNRKAASKCRTKQKRQHDNLVETAQEAERKNKVLKVEVELLKSDLRDLMELVERHNECPDGRLRKNVQRKADRLSARGDQGPIARLLSSKSSSKADFSGGGWLSRSE